MKVFISYSRDDLDFADQLDMALRDRGFDVYVDRRAINPAEPWKDRLGALIGGADTVVFLLTASALRSEFCSWEAAEAQRAGKRMIPVLPGPVQNIDVPPELSKLNYVFFYPDRSAPGSGFYTGLVRLEQALRQDLEWLRLNTRLTERAAEWSPGRSEELLLVGRPLLEALAWLESVPKGSNVPSIVREYLNACEEGAQRRSARAEADLAERKRILQQSEKDLAGRQASERRFRRFSVIALAAGAALLGVSIVGLLLAAANDSRARALRSEQLAALAQSLNEDGRYALAMYVALEGDPADLAGPFGALSGRSDRVAAKAALERGWTNNRLDSVLAHPQPVKAIAVSQDGRTFLTGSQDGKARLWRRGETEPFETLEGHGQSIESVALSLDGQWALTGSADRTAKLWKIGQRTAVQTFEDHTRSVVSVAFSPDGLRIVTGSNDFTAKIWERGVAKPIQTLTGHKEMVTSAVFSADGRRILTGSGDHTALLWEVGAARPLGVVAAHEGEIWSVAFSPNGEEVLTGGGDGAAQLWRLEGLVPDGSPGLPVAVRRFSETDKEVGGFQNPNKDVQDVNKVAFSKDGDRILTGSSDWTVKLWSVQDGETPLAVFRGHSEAVSDVAFSPTMDFAITASWDRTVRTWHLTAPSPIRMLAAAPDAQGFVTSTVFSPDGKSILAVSSDGTALLWSVNKESVEREFRTDRRISCAQISPDGKVLVTGLEDGRLLLWSLDRPGSPDLLGSHALAIAGVAFSPDGKLVVSTSSDETAAIWDLGSDAEPKVLRISSQVTSTLFFRNGTDILTTVFNGAPARRSVDGAPPRFFERAGREGASPDSYLSSALSHDGKFLITGGSDRTATVWSTDTGEAVQVLSGHPADEVVAVALSPDGSLALTASSSEDIRLWRRGGSRPVAGIVPRSGILSAAALSPDGTLVAAGVDQNRIEVWAVDDFIRSPASDQAGRACDQLRAIGLAELAAEARALPALHSESLSSCKS